LTLALSPTPDRWRDGALCIDGFLPANLYRIHLLHISRMLNPMSGPIATSGVTSPRSGRIIQPLNSNKKMNACFEEENMGQMPHLFHSLSTVNSTVGHAQQYAPMQAFLMQRVGCGGGVEYGEDGQDFEFEDDELTDEEVEEQRGSMTKMGERNEMRSGNHNALESQSRPPPKQRNNQMQLLQPPKQTRSRQLHRADSNSMYSLLQQDTQASSHSHQAELHQPYLRPLTSTPLPLPPNPNSNMTFDENSFLPLWWDQSQIGWTVDQSLLGPPLFDEKSHDVIPQKRKDSSS
jgi:hypothetical protein